MSTIANSYWPHWTLFTSTGASASMMESVILSALGGQGTGPQVPWPPMDLVDLNDNTLFLQVNSIKHSTSKGYATGTWDYINFCILHSLPLDPTLTTLSYYIAYLFWFIASGLKYLTGVQHFLHEIYPDFNNNCTHALIVFEGLVWSRFFPIWVQTGTITSSITFQNYIKPGQTAQNWFIAVQRSLRTGCDQLRSQPVVNWLQSV